METEAEIKFGQEVHVEYIYEDLLPRSNLKQEEESKKVHGLHGTLALPRSRTSHDGIEKRQCTSANLNELVIATGVNKHLDHLRARYTIGEYKIELWLGGPRRRESRHLYMHCVWPAEVPSTEVRWMWEYIKQRNRLWTVYKTAIWMTAALIVCFVASQPSTTNSVQSWWTRCLAPGADYANLANEAAGPFMGATLGLFLVYKFCDKATRARVLIRPDRIRPKVKNFMETTLALAGPLLPDRWARRATESSEAEVAIFSAIVAAIALVITVFAWLLPR